MKIRSADVLAIVFILLARVSARADVGDPQVRTDHRWYPGELACSTFEALFATQAELYEHVVGIKPQTDEQKALAAWLWRNTHYCHAEDGAEDLWGKGFSQGADARCREYWTGMFAHGFGLCGTTHAQWGAEMEALLGHSRGRCVGVDGHNSFEVFLKGGPYGDGAVAVGPALQKHLKGIVPVNADAPAAAVTQERLHFRPPLRVGRAAQAETVGEHAGPVFAAARIGPLGEALAPEVLGPVLGVAVVRVPPQPRGQRFLLVGLGLDADHMLVKLGLRREQGLKRRTGEFAGIPTMVRANLRIADVRAGRHASEEDEYDGENIC